MTLVNPNGEALRPSTRVLVAVHAGDTMPSTAAWSLASLLGATAATRRDIELNLFIDRDPIASSARQTAVVAALKAGYTHILFLSPNVVVPRDTVSRLLAHDAPVAAAAVVAAEIPSYPLAVGTTGDLVYAADDDPRAAAEVDQVSLHCALVNLRVFQEIDRPWFFTGYNVKSGSYVADELYFIQKVREHGHPVLVDLSLSREVTHLGEFEYRSAHALQSRDLAGIGEAPVSGDH
jgi:hypothetical protein